MGEGGYQQINKSLNACAFSNYLVTQHPRLPSLPDVEQISSRVLHVLGQNTGKLSSPIEKPIPPRTQRIGNASLLLTSAVVPVRPPKTNTYIVGTGSP